MRCSAVRFVWFFYYKTAIHTASCAVVHYYLRYFAVMPFYEQF